jgi:hypothetical protein
MEITGLAAGGLTQRLWNFRPISLGTQAGFARLIRLDLKFGIQREA